MNYGLYLSAAGTLASLHRQDVLANNLANLNTVGFKADMVTTRARLAQRLESPATLADPQTLLENLGGGVFADPTRIDLRQGPLAESHNDLDLALQGDGFFVVANGKSSGADSLRLTRDGRFTLDAAGELITATTGLRVLDSSDQAIRLNRGEKVRIDGEGRITQNGVEMARLQIAQVADQSTLTKTGDNLLRFTGKRSSAAASTRVQQGSVESSGVDPILALNDMINASKAVQANATMMQYHDQILGQAVNTFGRVA